MARKNLLAGLISSKLPAGNSEAEPFSAKSLEGERPPRGAPLGSRGAIGAVTRSIENLKSAASETEKLRARLEAGQTIVELDPSLVDPSPVADRMPDAAADLGEFIEAMRSGQQVPILVRPNPGEEGRYQVAYGHRRVRAARELGRPVRAVVRALSDAELVVAQGQENSARRDLSFIERALYAAKLEEAGFERETIMSALNTDKTGLSRLISVAMKIPRDIIEAIGPAPRIGRDRWTDLVSKLESERSRQSVQDALVQDSFRSGQTDERFELVLRAAQAPRPKPKATSPQGRRVVDPEGKPIGQVERAGKGARLTLADAPFAEFLADHLPRLHAEWRSAGAPANKTGGSPTKQE